MALMTVDEAKLYLRIDGDDEDTLIAGLLRAGEAYIKGAVDSYKTKIRDDDFRELAKLAQAMYVKEFYDNRDAVDAKTSPFVRCIMTQLQLWERV